MTKNKMSGFSKLLRPLFAFTVLLIYLSGCTKTITVELPPQVDLKSWPVIGIVDFAADTHKDLAPAATQKFMMRIQSAQPGVRLLELGSKEQVLQALHRRELDPETIKSIGDKYGVQAVLLGRLEISDVKPSVAFSPDLTAASANASVNGELSAKLLETATGATVWSNGAHGKWSVGGVTLTSGGLSNVGFIDPKEKYEQMLRDLTWTATNDFRPRYEKHQVN